MVLTIDLHIQQAAERALQNVFGPTTRGSGDRHGRAHGDILAMASSPTYDPTCYVRGITRAEWQRISDLHAEKNRATYENYMPGSIFKTVVGMAALEAGLNPEEIIHVKPNPAKPSKGHLRVGNHTFKDEAEPGDFNFRRALKRSSNSYFITVGLRIGPEQIIRFANTSILASARGCPPARIPRQVPQPAAPQHRRTRHHRQHLYRPGPGVGHPAPNRRPDLGDCQRRRRPRPRLVDRIESADPTLACRLWYFRAARSRSPGYERAHGEDHAAAMLGDTEDADGTGRKPRVPGMRICAETGTPQCRTSATKDRPHDLVCLVCAL